MKTTLKLKNASGIVDTFGGELISYKIGNDEYVWTGDDKYWGGHAPVLFPVAGAVKGDAIIVDGISYPIKKHGFARKAEHTLVESSDTKATFKFSHSEETLKQYPYKFDLFISHEIYEDGFYTEYRVVNTDDKEIMFNIGAHPGFNTGNIEDYSLVFENKENMVWGYTDEKTLLDDSLIHSRGLNGEDTFDLYYSDFDNDALIAKGLTSKSVKLVNRKTGKVIKFDYAGFNSLAIWTPPKKNSPFICLEPWNGLPANVNESGNLSDRAYIIKLEKGKEYKVGYKVTIS